MKPGISSWAYPWAVGVPGQEPTRPLTAFDLLERAVELRVHVVQIADNLPLHLLSEDELDRLHQRTIDLDLELEVGTVGIAPQHLRTYLNIATHLQSYLLRIVIDTPERRPSEEEIVRALKDAAPDFQRAGVRLLIENHDRFPASALKRMLEEIDNPYVGICLDTVNSLGSLEVVDTVLDKLRPWIMNVHLKDFTIERSNHKMGFLVRGAPLGEGRLDVPGLIRQIRSLPYEANLILELWPSPEHDLDSTLKKEQSWVGSSIERLHSWNLT